MSSGGVGHGGIYDQPCHGRLPEVGDTEAHRVGGPACWV